MLRFISVEMLHYVCVWGPMTDEGVHNGILKANNVHPYTLTTSVECLQSIYKMGQTEQNQKLYKY